MCVVQNYSTNSACVPPRWNHPLSLALAIWQREREGEGGDGVEAMDGGQKELYETEIPAVLEVCVLREKGGERWCCSGQGVLQ